VTISRVNVEHNMYYKNICLRQTRTSIGDLMCLTYIRFENVYGFKFSMNLTLSSIMNFKVAQLMIVSKSRVVSRSHALT
jgi:hypothetical protein